MTHTAEITQSSKESAAQNVIRPFRVNVSDAELADLRRRIAATRFPEKETVRDHSQGVPLSTVQALAKYWETDYDWRKCEAKLNAYPQFITTIDGLDIHFIHVKSKEKNALPIIITHGWPGSIVEQLKLIDPLTNPTAHGGRAEDAFDVVIPDMPGYGFSGKPTETGWGPDRIARAWVVLMKRLGYTKFVAQGGDWGAIVVDLMAVQAPPELLGIHTNMAGVIPVDLDQAAFSGRPAPEGLSPDEKVAYERLSEVYAKGIGYGFQMGLRPQSLYGVADSPVGLAAYFLDHDARSLALIARVFEGERAGLTRDDILDNITYIWLTGTGVSGARLYWEYWGKSYFGVKGVTIPVAVSAFPDELYPAPRSWAERAYPKLIFFNKHDVGGHFAGWEQPALLSADVQTAFRSLRRTSPGVEHPANAGNSVIARTAALITVCAVWLGSLTSPGHAQTANSRTNPKENPKTQTEVTRPSAGQAADQGEVRPFRVSIPENEVADLRRRLAATRWPDKETVADQSQGAQLAKLQELVRYWGTSYDWRKAEAKLNAYPQFTTKIDGLDIHFIHVRSRHPNAMPLVLAHGWPGSVFEQIKLIGPLTDPTKYGGRAEDAFDVVIPSLPGFGFSSRPTEAGWGLERIGRSFDLLMKRLGYTRYVAQGGDWGAGIVQAMGRQAPTGLLGLHTNLPAALTPDVEAALGGPIPASFSATERSAIEDFRTYLQNGGLSYLVMMGARPQAVGYGLTDSPAGMAGWMLVHSGFAKWSYGKDPKQSPTRDDVLDNFSLYWLTNTATSAARIYWENRNLSLISATVQKTNEIKVPVAITAFPDEVVRVQESWARRAFPTLAYFHEADQGGHFAMWEYPELFATELRAAFKPLRTNASAGRP